MTWEEYQHQIAELFRRTANAQVQEDIHVLGVSGENRQIDVHVVLNYTISLSLDIQIKFPLTIIVDAKEHAAPVPIGYVESIDGMRADVKAHVAIIAAANGFTAGAKRRASGSSVLLLSAPDDLLALLADLSIPWGSDCVIPCTEEAVVHWNEPSQAGVPSGQCEACGLLHLLCPDCGFVFGITNAEYASPISCPGACGRHFYVTQGPIMEIVTYDKLDSLLLEEAMGNKTKALSRGKVEKLIRKTKWQHWASDDPSMRAVKRGLFEWDGDFLRLTDAGSQCYTDHIQNAHTPAEDGRLPDVPDLFPE